MIDIDRKVLELIPRVEALEKGIPDYPYNLTAIATHLRELAKSIAKKLDISEQDAWDLCIEKLEYKYSFMTREDNNDSMS